jgi:polysaccharide transporter, PST family
MDKKIVVKNTISLLILQGSLYIVPLIIFPYLVRVLGIEIFGLLAFATATISFFRGVVEYGFNLSATKEITNNKHDNNKISELFSTIMISKFFLSIICLLILSILVISFEIFFKNWELFFITFLIIFGDLLFPLWFFQGMENMKVITYLQISYKIIFVLLVLIFVKTKEDFLLVPLLDSIGSVIIGFLSIYYVKQKYNIKFIFIKQNLIFKQLKDGWHIFLSRITVILYTSINTFILGIMTNNELVGIYSIAEKIYMAIRGLLNPFVQAIFPYLVRKYNENKIEYLIIIKKINIGYGITLILFSIGTYIFSDYLFHLISGKNNLQGHEILKIFAISIIFAIGTLYSSLLVVKGESHLLSRITFICMIINSIFIIPLTYKFNIYGLAYLFLTVQFIQLILQINYNKEIFFIKSQKKDY